MKKVYFLTIILLIVLIQGCKINGPYDVIFNDVGLPKSYLNKYYGKQSKNEMQIIYLYYKNGLYKGKYFDISSLNKKEKKSKINSGDFLEADFTFIPSKIPNTKKLFILDIHCFSGIEYNFDNKQKIKWEIKKYPILIKLDDGKILLYDMNDKCFKLSLRDFKTYIIKNAKLIAYTSNPDVYKEQSPGLFDYYNIEIKNSIKNLFKRIKKQSKNFKYSNDD